MSPIGQFEKVFLKFIKFQSHLKENLLMVIHSGCEWLGRQWVKVTLYFHLREKIAKRLHHRLSETILVREFKKNSTWHCESWKMAILGRVSFADP